MMAEPGEEIIKSLKELRFWIDGFMVDRAEPAETNAPFDAYDWPYDIDRTHYEALVTAIEFLEERRSQK